MTSATAEPSMRTDGRHAEGQGYGLAVSASVPLIIGIIGLAGLTSLGRKNQARALARSRLGRAGRLS